MNCTYLSMCFRCCFCVACCVKSKRVESETHTLFYDHFTAQYIFVFGSYSRNTQSVSRQANKRHIEVV